MSSFASEPWLNTIAGNIRYLRQGQQAGFTTISEAPLKLPDDRNGILSLAVSRHCPKKPKTDQSGHPAEQQCHFEKSTARKHGAEGTRAIPPPPPLSTQPTFRRQAEIHSGCSLASTPWSLQAEGSRHTTDPLEWNVLDEIRMRSCRLMTQWCSQRLQSQSGPTILLCQPLSQVSAGEQP